MKEKADEKELNGLKESLAETDLIGPLIAKAKTVDQAKALVNFFEAISGMTDDTSFLY